MAKATGTDLLLRLLRDLEDLQLDLSNAKLFLAQLDERSGKRFVELEQLILMGFRNTSDGLMHVDQQLSPLSVSLAALAETVRNHLHQLEEHEKRLAALES